MKSDSPRTTSGALLYAQVRHAIQHLARLPADPRTGGRTRSCCRRQQRAIAPSGVCPPAGRETWHRLQVTFLPGRPEEAMAARSAELAAYARQRPGGGGGLRGGRCRPGPGGRLAGVPASPCHGTAETEPGGAGLPRQRYPEGHLHGTAADTGRPENELRRSIGPGRPGSAAWRGRPHRYLVARLCQRLADARPGASADAEPGLGEGTDPDPAARQDRRRGAGGRRRIERLIGVSRIPAETRVFVTRDPFSAILRRESRDAQALFLGFVLPADNSDAVALFESTARALEGMPPTFLVSTSGAADLLA